MNHTTTLDQAIEDLRFIVSREDYTFAECSLAEEIVRRAESALLYVQAMKAKETQIAKGIPSAEGLEREAREHLERECGPIDCTLLLGEYSVCTLMVKFARKQLESHSRQLWLEAPQVAWLIEQAGLCLGFCEYKFAFVTFTNENALRFARQRDAIAFRETIKRSPFNLPVGDAVVTEHQWIGPKAESTPKPSPALPREEK